MNQALKQRLLKIESATGADLPEVLCLTGETASPRLWLRGTSRTEAEAVNASTAQLRQLLDMEESDTDTQ